MSKRNGQPLQVKVSTEELLEWAGRHAETEGSDFTIRGLLTFQQGTYISIDNGGPDD